MQPCQLSNHLQYLVVLVLYYKVRSTTAAIRYAPGQSVAAHLKT
jgi:hypothetical protein